MCTGLLEIRTYKKDFSQRAESQILLALSCLKLISSISFFECRGRERESSSIFLIKVSDAPLQLKLEGRRLKHPWEPFFDC